jgi:predicted RNA binding protein YcfA (HicA-like mRNA interferase family)
MTRLKLLKASELERLLFDIGFVKVRQKWSHAFTGMKMEGRQRFRTIRVRIYRVLYCGRFCVKST